MAAPISWRLGFLGSFGWNPRCPSNTLVFFRDRKKGSLRKNHPRKWTFLKRPLFAKDTFFRTRVLFFFWGGGECQFYVHGAGILLICGLAFALLGAHVRVSASDRVRATAYGKFRPVDICQASLAQRAPRSLYGVGLAKEC